MVLNASSLITLVLTETIDLLKRCYRQVYVPRAVRDEFSSEFTMPNGVKLAMPDALIVRTLTGSQKAAAETIGLGEGENEAMVLARDLGLPLVMDDTDAEKVAAKYDILVYHSLEFVRAAYRACFLERDEYDSRVSSFQASGRVYPEYIDWARQATK